MVRLYCMICDQDINLSDEELSVFKEHHLVNNNNILEKCPNCLSEPISANIRVNMPRSNNGMCWSGLSGFYTNTHSTCITVNPRPRKK